MSWRTARGFLALAALLPTACSLEGTWRAAKVEPSERAADLGFHTVTFDNGGNYTATIDQGGRQSTSLGHYKWNGWALTMTPREGAEKKYDIRFTGLNCLGARTTVENAPINATLEKQVEK